MARKKKSAELTAPAIVTPVTTTNNETAVTPRKKRGFEAARFQPTLGFMPTFFQDFNQELKNDLRALRSRSRDSSLNDPFAKRYLKTMVAQVIGPYGIQLKMGARMPNNTPDTLANYMLEQRWLQWCKSVTTDNKSLREALKLYLETVARDGEIFCVLRRGVPFGKYLLNLQFFEAEYVDINHNEIFTNGNEIRQGIEYDSYGKPVAYHMWKFHPEATNVKTNGYNERVRIPAEEVIHGFNKERVSQGRGYPWLSASLLALTHVKEYTKSELIASRVASAKMGFFKKPAGTDENVGDIQDDVDSSSFSQEATPGMFDVLPPGWEFTTFDPQNPNSNYSQFIKTILEAVAASLGIAYHTLSGDLSSANYSSLRQGALDERETFKECQQWMIESFLTPVFETWLTNVLAFQLEGIRLPMNKYDQFNSPIWRPRVYPWVDPQKEMGAVQVQLEQNIRSRTDIARSFGLDYVDVLHEIAAEQALARELGVVIEPSTESSLDAAVMKLVAESAPNTDDTPNADIIAS